MERSQKRAKRFWVWATGPDYCQGENGEERKSLDPCSGAEESTDDWWTCHSDTVIDGKVVVDAETLAESSTVTVLLRDNQETFELTSEEESQLLESIAAIEHGEFMTGERLLERLRRFG